MKPLLSLIAVGLLSAIIMFGADDKNSGQKSASKKSAKKDASTKGGGDQGTASLAEVQWQTWGPTECQPLHPGALSNYRGRSVTFTYKLLKLPKDAPDTVRTAQPYYLVPAGDNPIKLYAGQELIVQIVYDVAPPVSPSEAVAALMKEVPLVSIDIGSAQATALNPAPLRQTQGLNALSLEGNKSPTIDKLYACAYKQPLVGDTIPTVTISAMVKDVSMPLTLVQTSLPQVHTLSYFNVATGVIASTIRDKSFPRVQSATAATGAQYTTVPQDADRSIMPVLFFTGYLFRPIDAEAPFERWDLFPQPSIGFSLTSPSTDFFFGASSELFRRNVQLVYGYHYGQTTHLVPGQTNDPSSKDPPQTQKRFDNGAFVGLTFNIDFIKGLFSGGK